MARYFFHLVTPSKYSIDEDGSEFADAEAAFLCAHETAIEMSIDLMRDHGDPSHYTFEIADSAQQILFTLPFCEATGTAPSIPPPGKLHADVLRNSRRSADAASKLKESIEKTLSLLRETKHLLE